MTVVLLALPFLLVCGLTGCLVEAHRDNRRLRQLNAALMDGAARRLMDDVRPELRAALDRLGPDRPTRIDVNVTRDRPQP